MWLMWLEISYSTRFTVRAVVTVHCRHLLGICFTGTNNKKSYYWLWHISHRVRAGPLG